MSSDITQETEWNSLISGKKLVAADFWAPWCPYCMRLKPIFESIASKYPDITFVKINVDEQGSLASRYGIRGIPVIKCFCEGREVGEIVGYVPQNELEKRINAISSEAPACLANTSLKEQGQ
ncbi:MAG TPA: thioredoxin family protein [Nitrososphaeraceae archaeon]|jgi:thioredoxin 1|nr:thioredoxin family protein [Nitrososphaeraceae archaeon]